MFSSNYKLLLIAFLGLGFFAIFVFYIALQDFEISFRRRLVQDVYGVPVRMKIPVIRLDETVLDVGLTPFGVMGAPAGPKNVAWFNLQPRPGEGGSAIIVGHFGWKGGVQAAFDNLNKLHVGDRLYVEDSNGLVITFLVREWRLYDKNENFSKVFNMSGDGAHLNLITCGGAWNADQKSYADRLVIFADKEYK